LRSPSCTARRSHFPGRFSNSISHTGNYARCSASPATCELAGTASAAPACARLGADRGHLAARPDRRLGDHARQRNLGLHPDGGRAARQPALAGPLRLRPGDYPGPPRRGSAGVAALRSSGRAGPARPCSRSKSSFLACGWAEIERQEDGTLTLGPAHYPSERAPAVAWPAHDFGTGLRSPVILF
jgi:hypothetical protein